MVRLIDTEELEAEGEWLSDICRRGGVRDMMRERGGDSVDSNSFFRHDVGDSDVYSEVVRTLRIEPATEGTGLAEVDLDIAKLVCLTVGRLRMLLRDVTLEVEVLVSI